MNKEKIQELLESEEFVNEIHGVETPEELIEAFKRHGVDMSMEELKELFAMAKKADGGELGEDELENVAGGALWWALLRPLVMLPALPHWRW